MANEFWLLAEVRISLSFKMLILVFVFIIVGCLCYLSCKVIPHGTKTIFGIDWIVCRGQVRFRSHSWFVPLLLYGWLFWLKLRFEHPAWVSRKVDRFRDLAIPVYGITASFYTSDTTYGSIHRCGLRRYRLVVKSSRIHYWKGLQTFIPLRPISRLLTTSCMVDWPHHIGLKLPYTLKLSWRRLDNLLRLPRSGHVEIYLTNWGGLGLPRRLLCFLLFRLELRLWHLILIL